VKLPMTRPVDPTDFASAAMMKLVTLGLSLQNISISLPKTSGARVPRSLKRHILSTVQQTHGLRAILGIADALARMPEEPVLLALTRAASLQELLVRWRRMERFSHGRHFIDADIRNAHSASIQHRAIDDRSSPEACETALVISVLSALGERIVSGPVQVTSACGRIIRSDCVWAHDLPTDWSGRFLLAARPANKHASASFLKPRIDEPLLLDQLVARDPVHRWTIREMAAQLGVSSRTLQRKLKGGNTSASEIIRRARLNLAAARLLDTPATSLAEIGFLCGFSDQAHFTRTFSLHVGTTPHSYRSDFSARGRTDPD